MCKLIARLDASLVNYGKHQEVPRRVDWRLANFFPWNQTRTKYNSLAGIADSLTHLIVDRQ